MAPRIVQIFFYNSRFLVCKVYYLKNKIPCFFVIINLFLNFLFVFVIQLKLYWRFFYDSINNLIWCGSFIPTLRNPLLRQPLYKLKLILQLLWRLKMNIWRKSWSIYWSLNKFIWWLSYNLSFKWWLFLRILNHFI